MLQLSLHTQALQPGIILDNPCAGFMGVVYCDNNHDIYQQTTCY